MARLFNRNFSGPAGHDVSGPLLYAFLSGNIPWNFRKKHGTKLAVAVYSLDFVSAQDGYGWLERHILNLKYRRICRMADVFIAFDRHIAEDLFKYYYIPRQKTVVVDDPLRLQPVLSGIAESLGLSGVVCDDSSVM